MSSRNIFDWRSDFPSGKLRPRMGVLPPDPDEEEAFDLLMEELGESLRHPINQEVEWISS